jgi:hypothetical protein
MVTCVHAMEDYPREVRAGVTPSLFVMSVVIARRSTSMQPSATLALATTVATRSGVGGADSGPLATAARADSEIRALGADFDAVSGRTGTARPEVRA